MKFYCAFNAAIKNDKIARKNIFLLNFFFRKNVFLIKLQINRKPKYFRILEVLPVILTTYLYV